MQVQNQTGHTNHLSCEILLEFLWGPWWKSFIASGDWIRKTHEKMLTSGGWGTVYIAMTKKTFRNINCHVCQIVDICRCLCAKKCKDGLKSQCAVMRQSWTWGMEKRLVTWWSHEDTQYRKTALCQKVRAWGQSNFAWYLGIGWGWQWCYLFVEATILIGITGPMTQIASRTCNDNSAINSVKNLPLFAHSLLATHFHFCQI